MEDILVDYHIARATAEELGGSYEERNYRQALYVEAVMKKHGVTKAKFDSSLVYYYRRADRFEKIYQKVADRMEEQALVLGATEGEIGKYQSKSESGDTVNIWSERSSRSLLPVIPFNRWNFELEVDTSYRAGDSFLLQFTSDFVYQDGSHNGYAYLTVTYDNDSVLCRNIRFTTSGFSQLRIPPFNKHKIKRFNGFFYLDGGKDYSSTVRILFLNNIQMIRFHSEQQEEKISSQQDETTQEDSKQSGHTGGWNSIVPEGSGDN